MLSRLRDFLAMVTVMAFEVALATGCYAGPDPEEFDRPLAPSLDPCQQACGVEAGDVHRACLDAGGDDAACQAQADDAWTVCLAGCSETSGGTGEGCHNQSDPAGDDAATPTLDENDPDDPDSSTGDQDAGPVTGEPADPDAGDSALGTTDGSDTATDSTSSDNAGDGGTGNLATCPIACPDYAYLVYHQCLDQGGTLEQCEQEFEDAYVWCRTACEGAPEEPVSCEQTCEETAGEDLDACLAACDAPLEATCPETCQIEAEQHFDACVAEENPVEVCEQDAETLLVACVDQCPETSEATCLQGCEADGEQIYDTCLQAGGEEDQCRDQMTTAVDACTAGCDSVSTEPLAPCDEDSAEGDEEPCSVLCEEYAYQVYLECLENPAGDDCEHGFEIAFDGCLTGCELAQASEPCGR